MALRGITYPHSAVLRRGDLDFEVYANAQAVARRAEYDSERILDVLSLPPFQQKNARVLEIGSPPYLMTAALTNLAHRVTANSLPLPGGEAKAEVELRWPERSHTIPLHFFDAEGPFPFEDEVFDIVVGGEVFEHFYREPWRFLQET